MMNIDDESSVMAAVQQNGALLKCASQGMKNNFNIVMAAVENYGVGLEYASDGMKNK